LKFSILFDNYNYNKELQSLWGFSCLIKTYNKTILFDTGSNGRILLKNAKKMGIDFKDIDIVFISHNHWDHIGGLDTVIEENPDILLIVPSSLSKHLIRDLKTLVKEVMVINQFTQLTDHLYSTGLAGDDMPEQSLIIEENNQLYVIGGCSHPGIDTFENIAKTLQKPIKYTIGGFHMMYKKEKDILNTISKLSCEYITATHCTGDLAIKLIKEKYQDKFIEGGVGKIITF
jgi:7,8-dihydropterin-6-yl-methyl-4-(beta-D-ribofuranosyl)aminobenzene 5'-phosphate synthase